MRAMHFNIASGFISQAVQIAVLERTLASYKAAITEDGRLQAESILNSMNEEAANLCPRFNSVERDILLLALSRLVPEEAADRVVVEDLINTILAMHVTDATVQAMSPK
jgi:hypothetical protein